MIHVTSHAIQRYRERVSDCSPAEAQAALSGMAIAKAATFGARCVRLGTGQRVLLEGDVVVTVLPAGCRPKQLQPRSDANG